MAKYVGYKRPKDTKKTIKHLLVYLGHYKWMFMLVALLVLLSAGANVTGTKAGCKPFYSTGRYGRAS